MTRRLAAIMFTDIAGYTSLAQRDEAGALRLLQDQERLVRGLLEVHQGRLVKSMGDGLLIEFANALDAVECAVDLQRHIQERNARERPPDLWVRIGIHLGDVEGVGADILGDAVNIASRIEPLAEPGGVYLSDPVYGQVRNKVPYPLENLGPRTLRGVQDPVEVYRVRFPGVVTATSPSPSGSGPPRLAVLPLANISPDPNDEYFADGLTEELISVLSQARGLRVIARTSVMPFKSAPKSISQIGSDLGVDSVLEGSVRKAGDQVRITVQLIDVRTQEHRWSQTFDRTLDRVFAVQAEVAEKTVAALKVELSRSEHEAILERPTASLAAYESYLRGIRASELEYAEGKDPKELGRAVTRHFEDAIREDPQFSAAYAYLANHLLSGMGALYDRKEVVSRIRELVAKAIELNPNSSDAHAARGNLAFQVDRDWGPAEEEFQQAIALNPSNANAHFWYAFLLHMLQRFGESKKQHLAASELDPLWFLPPWSLVWVTMCSGDLVSAVALAEALVSRFSDNVAAKATLAWMYALTDRREEALLITDSLPDVPNLDVWSNRAAIRAYLGKPEAAQALLAQREEGRLPWRLSLSDTAAYYALVGDRERALRHFEQDMREGDQISWVMFQMPWTDSIRDDPRFIAVVEEIGLPTTIARAVRH